MDVAEKNAGGYEMALLFALLGLSLLQPAWAVERPQQLQGVGITERLGDQVSLADLRFRAEDGREVVLSDYFKPNRPVVLQLGYYECPTLCGLVFNGLVKVLRQLPWVPGEKFGVVTLSIDPREEPALASAKKKSLIEALGKPEAAAGWHLLTGTEAEIGKLARQVGFGYRYDPQDKQFAHPAVLVVLTPEGRVSRYLYGAEFAPRDLKLALLEASKGRSGTVIDRILLFCYRYDASTRSYSIYATRLIQAASALLVLMMGVTFGLFWRRERRARGAASDV
ncbi:MAG: SCO family protein [Oligoflexia bacterium]|nr:SCO family protein [Oligoflexia bacterium]